MIFIKLEIFNPQVLFQDLWFISFNLFKDLYVLCHSRFATYCIALDFNDS